MPEPELIHRGKVREVYAWKDQLLLVASDRISAFDVILPDPIPEKGIALTQMSKYWFDRLPEDIVHHVISFDVPEGIDRPEWKGRITCCRRTQPMPIECVVRGYLAGSGWNDYKKTGKLQGFDLPAGMKESDKLPQPLFTPSTKAQEGHDEPLTEAQAREIVGDATYELLRDRSIRIYQWAHDQALKEGIIIADTKFEFGSCDDGVLLIDEILTPDSSRFWPQDLYQPGQGQPSFDKQYVRDYLLSLKDWDRQPPGPTLPPEVIAETRRKYLEAYERITGSPLQF